MKKYLFKMCCKIGYNWIGVLIGLVCVMRNLSLWVMI